MTTLPPAADLNYYAKRIGEYEAEPWLDAVNVIAGDSLAENFPGAALPNDDGRTLGISGSYIAGATELLQRMLVGNRRPFRSLSVLVGVNDAIMGRLATDMIADYEALIASMDRVTPLRVVRPSRPVIITPLPVNPKRLAETVPHLTEADGEQVNAKLEVAARFLWESVPSRFVVIDGFAEFGGLDGLDMRYSLDGVHLNGRGVDKLAGLLADELAEPRGFIQVIGSFIWGR